MFQSPPTLAPSEEIVRQLAIFHRLFAAIPSYVREDDRPALLLAGYIADVLHNVPSMLWRFHSDTWNPPQEIQDWQKIFSNVLRHNHAPDRIIMEYHRIFTADMDAELLGISNDLSAYDLAPLDCLSSHLNQFYQACLFIRTMRNHGARPPHKWERPEDFWTVEVERDAALTGRIATALAPLPAGLVRWGRFDQATFEQSLQAPDLAFLVFRAQRTEQ